MTDRSNIFSNTFRIQEDNIVSSNKEIIETHEAENSIIIITIIIKKNRT